MRTDANLKAVCDALQQNCGDMHNAARQAGISPHFLYVWMKDDPEASKQVNEAQRVGWGAIESAIIQRAVHGVEKDVYYKGAVVGQQREYSDTLLGRLAEARIPEYKKGEAGTNNFSGPTQINIMPRAENFEQWLEMKRATLANRELDALPAPSANLPDILVGEYIEIPYNPMTVLDNLL